MQFKLLLAVLPVVLLIASCGPSEQQQKEEVQRQAKIAAQKAADEKAAKLAVLIDTMKAKVSSSFIDPSSAQFRDTKTTRSGQFCGFVNAKNQFGGYVGFQPFALRSTNGDLIILKLLTFQEAADIKRSFPTPEDRTSKAKKFVNILRIQNNIDAYVRDIAALDKFDDWDDCMWLK